MSPYNVLEAKAAAMPIVATKVGGIPDMITDNVNGLLVEPENVGSMVSAIERLVSDMALRQSLGMAAASDMTEAAIRMHAGKFEEFICKSA
jgi:glycosyltransferase involved in cell wall biosynthesis